jgi:TolB-like protein/DNA-binding winged helix-turn-helix (wHTH) protein/tetratricopeptide (TPR) repeat protein
METPLKSGFVVGNWQVYPDQGILSGPDGDQHLEPKVMGVLVFLAQREGEVARREELLSEIWTGTIVTDEALSRVISVLRTHLGDNSREPKYIQTIPKVGYRLLMPVTRLPPAATPTPTSRQPQWPKRRRWPLLLGAVAVFAAILMWVGHEKDQGDPGGPAGFASLTDWFDYLAAQREGSAGTTSIAVLPFEMLGAPEPGDAFSEGLTDELTNSLSQIKGLKVVARRSSYSFRNRNDDVPTVGRLLNVDAVLEGSVRPDGDSIRINAQLSDVDDGYLIWSDAVDVSLGGLYAAQESLVTEVVAALGNHFPDSRLEPPANSEHRPDNEAYRLYLMSGNFLWQLRGEAPLRKSIELYRQALALDPTFSRAHIALARSLVLLPFYSTEPMESTFSKAESVLNAQEYTDKRDQGEAESVRAFIAWNRWQWEEAEERFQRSLELAPDLPNTYQWYSEHLAAVGRRAEGLEAAKRARELDEISPVVNDRLGVAYLWVGDNIRAAEHFAISAQLGFRNAINPGYMILLIRLQRFQELQAILSALYRDEVDKPAWLLQDVGAVFAPDQRKTALAAAREARSHAQVILPRLEFGLWVLLGGIDEAYDTFNRLSGSARNYLQLEFVFTDEGTDFRHDPRFERLAREIGWRSYWDRFGGPDES